MSSLDLLDPSTTEEKPLLENGKTSIESQVNGQSAVFDNLIRVINKLQDVFSTVGSKDIQLPQIVVIGSQSAGKSSVLESIVGRSFLPRGKDLVTRCPLVLQLIGNLNENELAEEWGEFGHLPYEKFTDFEAIREEIENETEFQAGSNKGIVEQPIILKVFSPRVVNLTLVDLPGFTKVPIGDQPKDIEKLIMQLVLKYIENPNSIIVAVHPANNDMATSEALKVARQVDPHGDRTLAVLTKLDLMDEGTNALEVLKGNVISVKLGIIGVINRSQKGVDDKLPIEDQLQKEAAYISVKYPTVAAKHGTLVLEGTLSKLLMYHIHDCLPELENRIKAKVLKTDDELAAYGREISNKPQALHNVITEFSRAYCATIEGVSGSIENKGLCGITKLYSIIHDKLEKSLSNVQPQKDSTMLEVFNALKKASGPRPKLLSFPLFDPPFEKIVKNQIKQLQKPSKKCVELVHKEMLRNMQHCGTKVSEELQRFPKLQEKIFEVVTKLLRERTKITLGKIVELMDTQVAYINKKHPSFTPKTLKSSIDCSEENGNEYSGTSDSEPEIDLEMTIKVNKINVKTPQTKKNDLINCKVLEQFVNDYFAITRVNVQDNIPKTIMYWLVNYILDNMESELFAEVYKPQEADELLSEAKQVASKRQAATDMLDALTRASDIIAEISNGRAANFDQD